MSHRFKQLKPLGVSKKNTKSESEESHKKSPTVPESAGIFDFLYVDRARISALYAQLYPQGVLNTVKTTEQKSFSDEHDVGSDLKIIKADVKSAESGLEGIEQLYDATWSIPLEVLAGLKSRSLVRESLMEAGLGSTVLTNCHVRLIDFATMDKVWEPAMKAAAATQSTQQVPPESVSSIAEALKQSPIRSTHTSRPTKPSYGRRSNQLTLRYRLLI